MGARGDGGGRSGQDGFSTLFNPAIPWIPNHTMDTKPYHGYQAIPWIANYTMDSRLYDAYQTIPWIPSHVKDIKPYHEYKTIPCIPNYRVTQKKRYIAFCS